MGESMRRDLFPAVSLATMIVSTPAAAITVGFADSHGRPIQAVEDQPMIMLSGVIEPGDADKLERFIYINQKSLRTYPQERIVVYLNSPGGDVEEAKKIAVTLREIMADARVYSNMVCASSCFLLYVNAPMRGNIGTVAVHRPFLSPEKDKTLSAAEAARVHDKIYRSVEKWLRDRLVPQSIIEKLLSAPSTKAYVLTLEDLAAIGDRSPWYEEWLLARCPDFLEADKEAKEAFAQDREPGKRFEDAIKCENDALQLEVVHGLGSVVIRRAVAEANRDRERDKKAGK